MEGGGSTALGLAQYLTREALILCPLEALPGVDVQWGDTSIEALRAELDMAEIKVGHPNSTRAQLPLLKK